MLVGAGTIQVRSPVMENGYGIIKKFCEGVLGRFQKTVAESQGRHTRPFPFSESRILTKTYPDCFSVLLWHVSKERLFSEHTGVAGVHPETT